MTGLIILGVAVAVVLFTSLFKNLDWDARTANLIAVVLSAAGAGVYVLADNGWDVAALAQADLLATVTLVYGASQALYNFILKGTPLNETLETSLVKPSSVEYEEIEDVLDTELPEEEPEFLHTTEPGDGRG